jgi:hypothetical protein
VWADEHSFEAWRAAADATLAGSTTADGAVVHELHVGGDEVRVTLAVPGTSQAAFMSLWSALPPWESAPGAPMRVAPATSLLLIKRSHLYDPAGWHKHIADYHFLRSRVVESDITPAEREAGAARLAEWNARHTKGVGSGPMRVPNEVFFAGTRMAQIRAYEHDDLHRSTCYRAEPLYRALEDDQSLPFVSGRRFERFDEVDKLRLVREESYAIALERAVIPALELGRTPDARRAYQHALRRICTNLTTGWFRDFAIEHYPEVCEPDIDFVGRFEVAAATGAIRRIEPAAGPRPWIQRMQDQLDELEALDRAAGLVR